MTVQVARRGKGTVEGGAALYEMGHYHLHGMIRVLNVFITS